MPGSRPDQGHRGKSDGALNTAEADACLSPILFHADSRSWKDNLTEPP